MGTIVQLFECLLLFMIAFVLLILAFVLLAEGLGFSSYEIRKFIISRMDRKNK